MKRGRLFVLLLFCLVFILVFSSAQAMLIDFDTPNNDTWNAPRTVNFSFTPTGDDGDGDFDNCTILIYYFNGTHIANQTNKTAIVNDSLNGINYTLPWDGMTYLWSVECKNQSNVRNITTTNRTIKIGCGNLYEDKTYNHNVNINDTSCLIIGVDNLTVDGNGYTINGNNYASGYGIQNGVFPAYGFNNITIKNFYISGFSEGIRYINGATNGLIFNNTLINNSYHVSLQLSSNNNTILNNTMSNDIGFVDGSNAIEAFAPLSGLRILNNTLNYTSSAVSGVVVILQADDSVFDNNLVLQGYSDGVSAFGSNISITNNNISYNGGEGIEIQFTDDGTSSNISNNYIENNVGNGVKFVSGFYCSAESNMINGEQYYHLVNEDGTNVQNLVLTAYRITNLGKISVINSTNITLYNLTLNNNFYGLYIQDSKNLSISYSNVSNNTQSNIYLTNSHSANIYNNTLLNSSGSGIKLSGAMNNTIKNTDIFSNYYGVYIGDSDSYDNLIQDLSIVNSATKDISSSGETSNNTFLNVSFDKSKIEISAGRIYIKWYVDVFVNYSNRSIAPGATVNGYANSRSCGGTCTSCSLFENQTACLTQDGCSWFKNCYGTCTGCSTFLDQTNCNNQGGCSWLEFPILAFTGITNANGLTRQNVSEYYENATGKTYLTNYSMNATINPYSPTKQVNFTNNLLKEDNNETVLTIDNTNPVASLTIIPSSIVLEGSSTINCSATDSGGTGLSSVIASSSENSSICSNSSCSGNSCSCQASSYVPTYVGIHTITCLVEDNAGNSNSVGGNLEVTQGSDGVGGSFGGGGGVEPPEEATEEIKEEAEEEKIEEEEEIIEGEKGIIQICKKNLLLCIFSILFLIILIITIILFISKKRNIKRKKFRFFK